MSKPLAVIAGVGTGLGFSLAKQFSAEYKVILLSRSQDKLDALSKEITAKGGEAIGISTDLNSEENIAETFKKIKTLGQVNVAIFNASGGDRRYFKAPFLTIPADKFEAFWKTSAKGGFLFAQQSLPLLIETAKSNPVHPPTLLFTGATASIKASIDFAAFASSNGHFALYLRVLPRNSDRRECMSAISLLTVHSIRHRAGTCNLMVIQKIGWIQMEWRRVIGHFMSNPNELGVGKSI